MGMMIKKIINKSKLLLFYLWTVEMMWNLNENWYF